MIMKKIKLENNKSVLVGESADRSSQGFYIMIDKTSTLYLTIDEHKGIHERNDQWVKILCTINHSISLDVPMVIVEDEVEKYVNNNYFNYNYKNLLIECVKGYQATQQKSVYSEEDIRKAISNAVYTINPMLLGSKDYDIEENRIIQSLNKEYIELEMVGYCMVCDKGYDKIERCKGEKNNHICYVELDKQIKTTKDSNGQLIAYIKQ